ncbi:MAG: hypothetical protein DMF63_08620 [Acidobacteria bacterium]|nr:MAG: hypothetical protein DMF63_08620 [Acidobacteriota bacterium]
MNELDEAWSQMLAGAIENAREAGRGDVADFLALKRSNDELRQSAVDWLFNSFIEIASEANRRNSLVVIEREEPHEFQFNNAKMAGSLVRVRFGVRAILIEAGWTRLPSHGFMRGGALAAARISHFGIPRATDELILVRDDETPAWNSVNGSRFDSQSLFEHFRLLLQN